MKCGGVVRGWRPPHAGRRVACVACYTTARDGLLGYVPGRTRGRIPLGALALARVVAGGQECNPGKAGCSPTLLHRSLASFFLTRAVRFVRVLLKAQSAREFHFGFCSHVSRRPRAHPRWCRRTDATSLTRLGWRRVVLCCAASRRRVAAGWRRGSSHPLRGQHPLFSGRNGLSINRSAWESY